MALSDDVKARLDIVEVVGGYVPSLRKAGRNFSANCPFHDEKTPSFIVFPDRQSWRCFGACGTGGDALAFVMKQEQLDFPAVLRMLANRVGIQPKEYKPRTVVRDPSIDVNGLALNFFREQIETDKGSLARDYIQRRGITDESAERFGLGYAPSSGEDLKKFAAAEGISEDQLVVAGLLVVGENGETRELFKGRLTIPIWDDLGGLVGFGGREMGGGNPKYLNTPQTHLFDKGAILYGLDKAKQQIAKDTELVIVEGYTDVITAHQNGYRNVVASMGTALTETQVKLAQNYARKFVLALDADNAGQEATLRSLENSWKIFDTTPLASLTSGTGRLVQKPKGIDDLKIAVLPEGMDPDSIIRDDPIGWQRFLRNAKPVIEYLLDALPLRLDLSTSDGKAEMTTRLFPIITAMDNSYDQDKYFEKLALVLGVSTERLEASVTRPPPRVRQSRSSQVRQPEAAISPFRREIADPLEDYALAIMLTHTEYFSRAAELPEEHLNRHENKAMLNAMRDAATMGIDSVKPPRELEEDFERLKNYPFPEMDAIERAKGFEECLRRLEERHLRELKKQEQEVFSDGTVGDSSPVAEEHIHEINERLKQLFTGKN